MPPTDTTADFAEAVAEVAAAISDAESIFIAAHENPDGDAVGSLLALRAILIALGKTVHAATPTAPPDRFAFLDGFEAILTEPPAEPADLGIALDCDGADRLADLKDAILASATVIDVDHHEGDNTFGDIQLVDSGAAATAVLVRKIARELKAGELSPSQASALYVALIADTGCFRFTNTSPEAMRLGAELIAAGADPAELARRVFTIRPMEAVKLEARALSSLTTTDGVAIASLTHDDFAEVGAQPELTEGIIDGFRDALGVRVAALIKETEPGVWQVSMRGNRVDVAGVARSFGGGGHRFAAGCTIEGERAGVIARLSEALQEAVDVSQGAALDA
ncbi:MAG: bifunctional oligoribonuclease/PAP phosphatase NrnA [Armatimonadota bacterium]